MGEWYSHLSSLGEKEASVSVLQGLVPKVLMGCDWRHCMMQLLSWRSLRLQSDSNGSDVRTM